MHDTLKKPRELLAVAYGIRNPELAARSKHPGGEVDLDTMDAQVGDPKRNGTINQRPSLACGTRPTTVACCREADARNHMFQLYIKASISLRDQDWKGPQRYGYRFLLSRFIAF